MAAVCAAEGGWLRWWALEPLVATVAFAVWVNLFRVLENKGDSKAAMGAVFDVRKSTRVLRAGIGYWLFIYLFKAFIPPAAPDWGCPSVFRVASEVAFGLVAYDALFFCVHVLLHRCRWLSDLSSHHVHHVNGPRTNSTTVLHHSVVDGFFQVAANILVQRQGPFGAKTFVARLLHNVIVTYLLTESHSTAPWRLCDAFPRLLAGAKEHRKHHAHAGPPYQQFFGYLDAAMALIPEKAPLKKM
ncbi:hypothetical protein M885DRAFT_512193 [Pelagophyceae sp. CCMP2097]|nr:hypothetical protein M885DRAFT_512193 [Pelagophyceae sp. CCMP2097]|mmetsp:Transcript_30337/g.102360  ORF Transcript_30337/g.102360 Transcript_30337/m.102360 type:complete len:243 (+) Transcript_30337:196-924(+)